jgi:hypothetical protein
MNTVPKRGSVEKVIVGALTCLMTTAGFGCASRTKEASAPPPAPQQTTLNPSNVEQPPEADQGPGQDPRSAIPPPDEKPLTPDEIERAVNPSPTDLARAAQPGFIADTNRPFNEYVWLTSHNAFSWGADSGGLGSNQEMSPFYQLARGVRGLMFDIHGSDVLLCHGICYPGSRSLAEEFKLSVMPTLALNRNAIITVFLEDYTNKADLTRALGSIPNLATYTFKPTTWSSRKQWPTLSELINANQRLFIITNKSQNAGDHQTSSGTVHLIYDQNLNVENTYNLGDLVTSHDYSCDTRWNSIPLDTVAASSTYYGWTRLFVMNHFHKIPYPLHGDADNRFDKLLNRDQSYCRPKANRRPNFIALDQINRGDATEYVEWQNNGGVIFYEGNDGTQDIVCGFATTIARTIDLQSSDEERLGCENDEARSLVLSGAKKGARITLYDSPSGNREDDWYFIEVKRDIGMNERVVVPSFEESKDTSDYRAVYLRNNGLNGKVSRIRVEPQAGDMFADAAVVLYEGNNASQNIVCTLPLTTSQLVKFKSDSYGCDNDEARSAKIVIAKAGTTLTVYDDPNGGTGDDYTTIYVKQDILQPRVIGTFQSSFEDSFLKVTFKNHNGLDGKVSSARIQR